MVEEDLVLVIKDSGNRREFKDGAVRDMSDGGKGRFDLLPLYELCRATDDGFFNYMADFVKEGEPRYLFGAAKYVLNHTGDNYDRDAYNAILSFAKHMENGMKKYGQDNWRKGIPLSSYVDSSCRHYCKWRSGWQDEDHLSACLFNLLCGAWTAEHKPEYNDFVKED